MGLSPEVVDAHVEHWRKQLAKGNRPYRQHWPQRLFRHEPLENAVKILQSGVLLSRDSAAADIARDIAPTEIIGRRVDAHRFARLYFRPKSPTQFRIEGIKKPNELYQGRHAPILIIMVFRASDILTRQGVEFSDGNMQSNQTVTGQTDAEFQTIPFDQVYHEGSFDPQSALGVDILRRRCAEVLVPDALLLPDTLQGVLCRSPAERATLLHFLGDAADLWNGRIRVFTEPGLFESRYAYMNTVDVGPEGVRFTISPRRDGASVTTTLRVWDEQGNEVVRFGPSELNPAQRWITRKQLGPGGYMTRFELEGCLAYEARSVIDDLPF